MECTYQETAISLTSIINIWSQLSPSSDSSRKPTWRRATTSLCSWWERVPRSSLDRLLFQTPSSTRCTSGRTPTSELSCCRSTRTLSCSTSCRVTSQLVMLLIWVCSSIGNKLDSDSRIGIEMLDFPRFYSQSLHSREQPISENWVTSKSTMRARSLLQSQKELRSQFIFSLTISRWLNLDTLIWWLKRVWMRSWIRVFQQDIMHNLSLNK